MANMGDDKRKHLEFIQNAINRMASNSFMLKGWTVLLVSALLAFFTRYGQSWHVFVVIVPVMGFWILDGFFLSQERLFRSLYDRVRTLQDCKIDYSMDTSDFRQIPRNRWHKSALSRTLLIFYGAVLLAVCLIAAILAMLKLW